MENVIHTVLEVGLEKPVKLLHVTDVHLTNTDPSDSELMRDYMARRTQVFIEEAGSATHTPSEYFEDAFRLAEEEGALVVISGDVMDHFCKGSADEFKRIVAGKDFLFTPGSHDFTDIQPTDNEKGRHFVQVRSTVEAYFPDWNFAFSNRIINGLNVIAIDDGQDIFPIEACEKLRKEAEKGLPMVLFMHDPLSDGGLLRQRPFIEFGPRTDEEFKASDELIEFIGKCPQVIATFAGHWHSESDFVAPCGARVLITPSLVQGACRLIEIR